MCFFEGKEIVAVCNFCAWCSHGRNSAQGVRVLSARPVVSPSKWWSRTLSYKRFNLLAEKKVDYIFLGNRIGITVLVTFSISVQLYLCSLFFPSFCFGKWCHHKLSEPTMISSKSSLQFGSVTLDFNFWTFHLIHLYLSSSSVWRVFSLPFSSWKAHCEHFVIARRWKQRIFVLPLCICLEKSGEFGHRHITKPPPPLIKQDPRNRIGSVQNLVHSFGGCAETVWTPRSIGELRKTWKR
jgi:hypothetical protein